MNRYTKENRDELLSRAKRLEEVHENRRTNHELDHSLWRLDEFVLEEVKHNTLIKKEDYPSFTSNNPKTLSRAVMALLSKNPPLIRINVPVDTPEEEEDIISANEQLAYGALYDADMLRARSDQNKLQWELAWYIAHRGGVLVRPLYQPEKRTTPFRIKVYDPYECVWDSNDDDGLFFFARHYQMDLSDARVTYGFSSDANIATSSLDTVEVYDIWWLEYGSGDDPDPTVAPTVHNAIIVGDQWAKEPTRHSEFDHIPVYCIRAGGTPARMQMYGSASADWRTEQWESIYTGVRETIGWINRAVTLFGLYLRNGAIGPWVYEGKSNKNIQKGLHPFKVVRIAQNEKFGPSVPPAMAKEAKEFLTYVTQEWQRAGVSEIIFGGLPFTISGFGMLQLRSAVEILIGNFVDAMETAYTCVIDELTDQFVRIGGRRTLKVQGLDKRQKVFFEKIAPRDIKKRYIIDVTLKNALPDDPVAKGNAATLWRNAGAPRKAVYEEVFETQDAAAWDRQFAAEAVDALPPVLLLNAIKACLRQGRREEAAILMRLLQTQMGDQMGNLNQGEGQNIANPGEEMAMPQNQPAEVAGKGEREGESGGGGRPAEQAQFGGE